MHLVIHGDYYSFQIQGDSHEEMLEKVKVVGREISENVKSTGDYTDGLMDDVIREHFPTAYESDQQDLCYDYIYMIDVNSGEVSWEKD